MRFALGGVVVAALSVACSAAGAQTLTSSQAGFSAILLTPSGALPLVVRAFRGADTASRFGVDARYGRYQFEQTPLTFSPVHHSGGIGAQWQVMHRLRIDAVVGNKWCERCQGTKMASIGADVRVWQHQAADAASTDVDVLVNAGIGSSYGDESRVQGRNVSAMLPIAIALPQQGDGWLTLYFAPGLSYGYLNDGRGNVLGYPGGDGAILFSANAGVAYAFDFGLGLHADLHRLFIPDSPTQLGFAISWRVRRTPSSP